MDLNHDLKMISGGCVSVSAPISASVSAFVSVGVHPYPQSVYVHLHQYPYPVQNVLRVSGCVRQIGVEDSAAADVVAVVAVEQRTSRQ